MTSLQRELGTPFSFFTTRIVNRPQSHHAIINHESSPTIIILAFPIGTIYRPYWSIAFQQCNLKVLGDRLATMGTIGITDRVAQVSIRFRGQTVVSDSHSPAGAGTTRLSSPIEGIRCIDVCICGCCGKCQAGTLVTGWLVGATTPHIVDASSVRP